MRITSDEMVFVHNITQGEQVFGFNIRFLHNKNEDVIQGLIKKGILESEERLSQDAYYLIKAIEDYKNSSKHIILNSLHLAPLKNGDMVMIYPIENDYEVGIVNNMVIWYFLIKKYEFLRGKKEVIGKQMNQSGLDDVIPELYQNENNIIIGEFIDKVAIREYVFYYKDGKNIKYDFASGKKFLSDGYEMRIELGTLLGLQKGF